MTNEGRDRILTQIFASMDPDSSHDVKVVDLYLPPLIGRYGVFSYGNLPYSLSLKIFDTLNSDEDANFRSVQDVRRYISEETYSVSIDISSSIFAGREHKFSDRTLRLESCKPSIFNLSYVVERKNGSTNFIFGSVHLLDLEMYDVTVDDDLYRKLETLRDKYDHGELKDKVQMPVEEFMKDLFDVISGDSSDPRNN